MIEATMQDREALKSRETIAKDRLIKNAAAYINQGNYRAAISIYEKIFAADANALQIGNCLGDLYLRTGQKEKAIDTFHKIAGLYCKNGFNLRAIGMYKKILKQSLKAFWIEEKIGDLYAQLGQVSNARQIG